MRPCPLLVIYVLYEEVNVHLVLVFASKIESEVRMVCQVSLVMGSLIFD